MTSDERTEGQESAEDKKARALINIGSEMVGAGAGGALGFILGGPGGAYAGGIAGVGLARLMKRGLSELDDRYLSRREKARVGATAIYAANAIDARVQAGDVPRDDGFWKGDDDDRSPAAEIFEGVLIKAKNEHQEKKLELLGNFFANLAFTEIGIADANHLLRAAEQLTYRQMIVLKLVRNQERIDGIRIDHIDNSDIDDQLSFISLMEEIYRLAELGILRRVLDNTHDVDWFDLKDSYRLITPRTLTLTPLGIRLVELIDTDSIDADDVEDVAVQLGLDLD